MTQQLKLAVLYHIFYEDSVYSIAEELNVLKGEYAIFLFNICSETPDKKRIIAFVGLQRAPRDFHALQFGYVILKANDADIFRGAFSSLHSKLQWFKFC